MYTVLWIEKDENEISHDRWDRFETEEEVREKLVEIDNDPNACCIGDVWIFGPEADKYAEAGDEFLR